MLRRAPPAATPLQDKRSGGVSGVAARDSRSSADVLQQESALRAVSREGQPSGKSLIQFDVSVRVCGSRGTSEGSSGRGENSTGAPASTACTDCASARGEYSSETSAHAMVPGQNSVCAPAHGCASDFCSVSAAQDGIAELPYSKALYGGIGHVVSVLGERYDSAMSGEQGLGCSVVSAVLTTNTSSISYWELKMLTLLDFDPRDQCSLLSAF